MKVQVRVSVKAKCVVKTVSAKGAWERGEGRLRLAGWGDCAAVTEGPGGPLPLITQNGQKPEPSGWGEKPQISCPLAGNVQAFGGGKESRGGKKQKKNKQILIKRLCQH